MRRVGCPIKVISKPVPPPEVGIQLTAVDGPPSEVQKLSTTNNVTPRSTASLFCAPSSHGRGAIQVSPSQNTHSGDKLSSESPNSTTMLPEINAESAIIETRYDQASNPVVLPMSKQIDLSCSNINIRARIPSQYQTALPRHAEAASSEIPETLAQHKEAQMIYPMSLPRSYVADVHPNTPPVACNNTHQTNKGSLTQNTVQQGHLQAVNIPGMSIAPGYYKQTGVSMESQIMPSLVLTGEERNTNMQAEINIENGIQNSLSVAQTQNNNRQFTTNNLLPATLKPVGKESFDGARHETQNYIDSSHNPVYLDRESSSGHRETDTVPKAIDPQKSIDFVGSPNVNSQQNIITYGQLQQSEPTNGTRDLSSKSDANSILVTNTDLTRPVTDTTESTSLRKRKARKSKLEGSLKKRILSVIGDPEFWNLVSISKGVRS